MYPTTTQAMRYCKANLVKSEGKRAEDSKFGRSVYFANRLSHCIWLNLPTVKPKIVEYTSSELGQLFSEYAFS